MPNHPANSFYYPRLKELPPIASVRITQQSRSHNRQAPMSNHILPNSISPHRFSGKIRATLLFDIETSEMFDAGIIVFVYIVHRNKLCFCRFVLSFSYISHLFSVIQRHPWTVKCHSGHPGVCVWVPAPEAACATVHDTSSCGRLMLASPALSWRSRLSVYHTAVWKSINLHRDCQDSTLGQSFYYYYYCWTEKLASAWVLENLKDCVSATLKQCQFKTFYITCSMQTFRNSVHFLTVYSKQWFWFQFLKFSLECNSLTLFLQHSDLKIKSSVSANRDYIMEQREMTDYDSIAVQVENVALKKAN